MDVLIECCCGLDVHKATIVACLLKGKPHRKPHKEVRSWASTTSATRLMLPPNQCGGSEVQIKSLNYLRGDNLTRLFCYIR